MTEEAEVKPLVRQSPPLSDKGLVRKQRLGRGGWIALSLAVLLVAAIGAVWWYNSGTEKIHYTTLPVTRGNITRAVTATGTVNPVLTIIVGSYVSGIIQELFCDYNTLVKAGQICAKIDPRPYKAVLDQYSGQLARDQAVLDKDRLNLMRYQGLVKQNSMARQQAEDQLYVVRQGEGTVKLDGGLAAGAALNLAYTDIVSPVEGIVVSRNVTQGQTVASSFQTPTLFLIATDLTKMQVDTNTSESDIGSIKEGNSATFTVDAYPGQIFNGKVSQVRQSPQTVQNVVTFDAVVSVDNKDLTLRPGMTASTRIISDQREDVIRVPNQALRFVPGGPSGTTPPPSAKTSGIESTHLWLLRDGIPTQIDIVPGLDDDNFTEITKGDLKPGDAVIVGEEHSSSSRSQRLPLPRF
ncbi:efflux RND transporter periplasmic adaptor subunit [Methylocella tundrae]|uniref:Efflux transporter periplasmic adaptor subunit n=1 Tax=Methylocella tundrae TaxID=227605 RepID=A0A4U8Z0P3_METTU|nr:efflux RND transporter periplasmic adaptor subunit [Methylocella tundrae]WPP06022.1 efflux RND transporter periplasmic adaptor subunit [Methylocella tundrae]VFU08602.1 Efflux transporter periplasmic adaptor subunit [Methylocella tundrae]